MAADDAERVIGADRCFGTFENSLSSPWTWWARRCGANLQYFETIAEEQPAC